MDTKHWKTVALVTTVTTLFGFCSAGTHQLFDDLFGSNYSTTIRPTGDTPSGAVMVRLGLKLIQIMDVVCIVHFREHAVSFLQRTPKRMPIASP